MKKWESLYQKIRQDFLGSEAGFYIASQLFLCILAGTFGSALLRAERAGFLLGAGTVYYPAQTGNCSADHSRGGEMIADAYLFNQGIRYPSNGMFPFENIFPSKLFWQ